MPRPDPRPSGLLREAGRYGVVVVLGFAIDLGVAAALAMRAGVPLAVAAVIGFVVALAFNYAAHGLWTFRDAGRPLSGRHAAGFVAVSLMTVGVRLVALAAFERLAPPPFDHPVLLLTAAAGVSLIANFVVLRATVFARRPPAAERAERMPR